MLSQYLIIVTTIFFKNRLVFKLWVCQFNYSWDLSNRLLVLSSIGPNLSIRLRSQNLKHLIPGNSLPELQGQHLFIGPSKLTDASIASCLHILQWGLFNNNTLHVTDLQHIFVSHSNDNEIVKDIFLGLDVVNSRQAHLTERVSIENEKFYQSEEEFNLAEAIQKTK